MNLLRFAPVLILALSACGGSGGSPVAATTSTGGGSTPAVPVWRVELEGDNTTFALSMVADGGFGQGGDEETQGPAVNIPAGQIVSYEVSGAAFTSGGVTRTGGVNVASGGPWMYIRLYKDGVLLESGQLSTSGTTHNFQAH